MNVEYLKLYEVSIARLYNKELADRLLPLCDYFTDKTTTTLLDIHNYPSTLQNFELSKEVNSHPLVIETFDYIFSHMNNIASRIPIGETIRNVEPYGFFSRMEKGNYLRKHRHNDCNFSGCFYLDVTPSVPGIVFFNPNPYLNTPTVFNTEQDITAGTMLIWPKWLEHEVNQKLSDEPRKVFTFNV